jgi:transposase-like protein
MPSEPTTYPGYRFPAEVIHHATWLYHGFSLSLRDIELILAERGVVVSHESIRCCASASARTSQPSCASGGRGRVTPGT